MNLWNCFLRIAASTLASHPLVHTALSSLNTDQFLEAAVNGIACIPTWFLSYFSSSLFHSFSSSFDGLQSIISCCALATTVMY
jgi:hypothetical protein